MFEKYVQGSPLIKLADLLWFGRLKNSLFPQGPYRFRKKLVLIFVRPILVIFRNKLVLKKLVAFFRPLWFHFIPGTYIYLLVSKNNGYRFSPLVPDL